MISILNIELCYVFCRFNVICKSQHVCLKHNSVEYNEKQILLVGFDYRFLKEISTKYFA